MSCPQPTPEQFKAVHDRLQVLLTEAIQMGIGVSVVYVPMLPLRMGNKVPQIDLHPLTPTHYNSLVSYLATRVAEFRMLEALGLGPEDLK